MSMGLKYEPSLSDQTEVPSRPAKPMGLHHIRKVVGVRKHPKIIFSSLAGLGNLDQMEVRPADFAL